MGAGSTPRYLSLVVSNGTQALIRSKKPTMWFECTLGFENFPSPWRKSSPFNSQLVKFKDFDRVFVYFWLCWVFVAFGWAFSS